MAINVRLHWFWRVMVSAAVAAVLGGVGVVDSASPAYKQRWIPYLGRPLVQAFQPAMGGDYARHLAMIILLVLIPVLVALGIYGLLTRWLCGSYADGELHCRRCDHILRGLSEPRCPECGESI